MPIQFGELGVKKLLPFGNTLLGENILGLCSGKGVRDHLWRRVSTSMFLWWGWYSNVVLIRQVCGNILGLAEKISPNLLDLMWKNDTLFFFGVTYGAEILYWRRHFLSYFKLLKIKYATVSYYTNWLNGHFCWN